MGKGTTTPHGAVTESLHTRRLWSGFQTSRVFANLTIRLWPRSSNSKHFCCGDTHSEPPLSMPGPHLRLRLLVPSLCSGTCNAPHSLRSHSYAHTHTHGFTLQRRPHMFTSPADFLSCSFCGPLVLLSRGHFPPGSPRPASFFFYPSVLAAPWERRASRGGVTSASHEGWVVGEGWDCRAGLRPAPCLFSLSPLNARLRCKDYPGRIMPGVNTQANKSACTTRQPRWDPGRGLGERTRSSLLITNK